MRRFKTGTGNEAITTNDGPGFPGKPEKSRKSKDMITTGMLDADRKLRRKPDEPGK